MENTAWTFPRPAGPDLFLAALSARARAARAATIAGRTARTRPVLRDRPSRPQPQGADEVRGQDRQPLRRHSGRRRAGLGRRSPCGTLQSPSRRRCPWTNCTNILQRDRGEKTMADTMQGLKRTHYCAALRDTDAGAEVTVCGWVGTVRQPRRADLHRAARPHRPAPGRV